MKARDVITFAFDEVVQLKSDIGDAELIDGLRYLNRMMAKFEYKHGSIGYTPAGLDDEITVPDAAILGIIKNLSLLLWKQYSSEQENPLIGYAAKRGLNTIQVIATDAMPDTDNTSYLPKGSGNYDLYQDPFYTNEQEADTYIGVENV